jgi:hypothetical protein
VCGSTRNLLSQNVHPKTVGEALDQANGDSGRGDRARASTVRSDLRRNLRALRPHWV